MFAVCYRDGNKQVVVQKLVHEPQASRTETEKHAWIFQFNCELDANLLKFSFGQLEPLCRIPQRHEARFDMDTVFMSRKLLEDSSSAASDLARWIVTIGWLFHFKAYIGSGYGGVGPNQAPVLSLKQLATSRLLSFVAVIMRPFLF
ncbi:uncharacterized protein A4U43_C08F2020 [Asparagus officinalis]|nr:uncharacterized protein A4U43_C08F2020 [Asparagus officinalis]